MSSEGFQDTVKLSPAKRTEMLRLLDNHARQSAGAPSKREHDRFEYRAGDVPITITHPGGGTGKFIACTRNLSSGGMSFLHGGFLHKGTHCRVVLPKRDGRETVVLGRVAGCRHIAQRLHEVGVEFYEKIDVREFCQPTAAVTSSSDSPSVLVPELEGLALCIIESPSERSTVARWLTSSGIDAEGVDCLGAAIDKLRKLPFDVVLLDTSLPEVESGEAARSIRAAGFELALVALIDEGAEGERLAQGCDTVLGRPLNPADLYTLLPTIMIKRSADAAGEPIRSTLPRDAGAFRLLKNYTEECRQSARRLREAISKDDRAGALSIARHLQSTASGYGFAPLVEAAARAVDVLGSSEAMCEAEKRIKLLASICQRVTSDPPAQKAA